MNDYEVRLVVEVALFSISMVVLIGGSLYAVVTVRQHSPSALDKLRQLVDDMSADMSERMDGYDTRQARDRQEMDRLHAELTDWKAYSREQADYGRQLVALLREMGYAGEIPSAPSPPTGTRPSVAPSNVGNDRMLAIELAKAFNLDELRDLEFHLGVPDGSLAEDTITARTRELVRWCRRRGRVEELRAAAMDLRPEWRKS